ncbi:zinc ribbon domain-containing protein [Chloroflexota bacterium]
MPIYDFRCHVCGEVSEFLVASSADVGTLACSSCGSQNLEKLISAPSLLKGRGNTAGATCCVREERCETSPCSTGERCRRA